MNKKELALEIFNNTKNNWGYAGLEYDEETEISAIEQTLDSASGCLQLLENELYNVEMDETEETIIRGLIKIIGGMV